MIVFLMFSLVAGEYFVCDSMGHACEVGTTCCARKNGGYGCCPMGSAVCCADSEGHCCPLGYPICDVLHKRCSNHLQLSAPLEAKKDALNIADVGSFLYGLASGLGIKVSQYTTCTEQLSISISLLVQVTKYLSGGTTLDNLIVLNTLGNFLGHMSQAGYSCMEAARQSENGVEEFFKAGMDRDEMMWVVGRNVMVYGNYIEREVESIGNSDWEGKGYAFGKIATYLFQLR
jgi:hypothetical protein